jgi:lipopolysaccharide biosynthesis regulator YciM
MTTGIDAWWLLLPLAFFALGWFAARIDIRYVLREARSLPAQYFRGLNYLLRQEQDKAVESFVDISRRDPHSLDLQLALGSLFRQQGKIAEATRIHQSMVDRHDVPKEKRELAQFELAQDYHAAGLFDRAEAVYESLRGTAYEAEAEAKLASVLEQEKEWAKAVRARERVEKLTGAPQGAILANYRCEEAEAALLKGDPVAMETALTQALSHNRNSGRVRLLRFRAAVKAQDWASAEAALLDLERVQPELIVLVADEMEALYTALGQPGRWLDQLSAVQAETRSSLGLTRLIDASLKVEGRAAALERLKRALADQPSAREAARWLELEAELQGEPAATTMREVANLLRRATDRTPGFHCRNCGFQAPRYYWKCPGCNQWDRFTTTPLS